MERIKLTRKKYLSQVCFMPHVEICQILSNKNKRAVITNESKSEMRLWIKFKVKLTSMYFEKSAFLGENWNLTL